MWRGEMLMKTYRGKIRLRQKHTIIEEFEKKRLKNHKKCEERVNRLMSDIEQEHSKRQTFNKELIDLVKRLYTDAKLRNRWLSCVVKMMNSKMRFYSKGLDKAKEESGNLLNKIKDMQETKYIDLELPSDQQTISTSLLNGSKLDDYDKLIEFNSQKEYIIKHARVRAIIADNAKKNDIHKEYLIFNLIESLLELIQFGNLEIQEIIVDKLSAFLVDPDTIKNIPLNVILYGNPGTGKTELATRLSKVIGRMGLLVFENCTETTRVDYIAPYLGQSVIKTHRLLVSNIENIILLDEAYSLTQYTNKETKTLDQYSKEVIDEIVGFISKYTGKICIIAAGYKDEMYNEFLQANVGLDRRFPIHIGIKDKTSQELSLLFINLIKVPFCKMNLRLTLFSCLVLENIIQRVYNRRDYYTCMYSFFKRQAAAMVDLADAAITIALTNKFKINQFPTEIEFIQKCLEMKIREDINTQTKHKEIDESLKDIQNEITNSGEFAFECDKIPQTDFNLDEDVINLDKDLFEYAEDEEDKEMGSGPDGDSDFEL